MADVEQAVGPADAPPTRWAHRARRVGQGTVDRIVQLGATLAAGLLLCVSFPPFGWWYCAFLGLALLAWVLTRDTTTPVGGFGYGYLFGLAFYIPLLPWISGLVGAGPWLGLAGVQALFPALFGALAVIVRRLKGWPLWFAALWVGQEWLKSSVPFGGFPWGVVGFSQTTSPVLALAQLGGAPLVSLAVALVGFCLTALTAEIVAWLRQGDTQRSTPPAVVLPGLAIAVTLLGTAIIWPQVRHAATGAVDDQPVTVAAVQGNVPRLGLDFNAQRRAVLDNHVNETMRLAEDVRAGRAPQPMFVVWPENSSDIDPLANADAGAEISAAAQAVNAPILVGGVVRAPGYTRDHPVSTNSVIVWNPGSGPADRHDKKIVQPFGEYLPWRDFFSKLSPYADRAGYFLPGDGDGVVSAAGVPVGVTTCWEVIFDRAARESVRGGAQVLAVPANNATFTEAMSEQQLAFSRLRAVEHDRFVVAAGTTGISAIIAPDGRELVRTQFFEPAYLDRQIRLKTDLTPATRWGPAVQAALVAVGVAAVIVVILHNGNFVSVMRRRRTAAVRRTETEPPRVGGDDGGTS
ncbi:apolipoprotein N-acyltransferase [Mycolicibacterium sp. S2-37]|uniref:apolipoprotein N-acyltransferase n=1 Tax=Mycolicibacterium sp. S2-37 TaxID=2810297 RepID=UPI001A941D65|nr:apolipoprotein N-acyltransferase [Mycolicibacterium sp. S2-37]MBO0676258.1 apolipoprotein N-acyltransferase [Mycolicibacterium sp. S2-37]